MTAPDPMKGLRGIFAATLVLESIVVLLALLVVPLAGGGPVAIVLIVSVAVLMILAAGVQRRSWGLGLALGLQVATVACGLLVPALGVLGLVFGLVWGFLLYVRRDVAQKMARGELPSQQVREP